MFLSHRFGSVETLSRAQFWLTHHGFEVVRSGDPMHDVSRLTLNVNFSKASAALALIDSIERSDPDAWPGNSTPARSLHGPASSAEVHAHGPHAVKAGTPIHLYPLEETSPVDPVSTKTREYMLSRWE